MSLTLTLGTCFSLVLLIEDLRALFESSSIISWSYFLGLRFIVFILSSCSCCWLGYRSWLLLLPSYLSGALWWSFFSFYSSSPPSIYSSSSVSWFSSCTWCFLLTFFFFFLLFMNSASNLYLIISLRLVNAGFSTSSRLTDLSLYRDELLWSSTKFSLPDLCDNIGSVGMSKFWSVWSLGNVISDLLWCVFLTVMFLSIS